MRSRSTPHRKGLAEGDGAGRLDQRAGRETHPVVWTNRYGKARVFGTTFGRSDEMFKDSNFIKSPGNGIRRAATGN